MLSSKSTNDNRTLGPVTGASTVGAALGFVLPWLFSLIGFDVPEPVAGALVVLLCALGGYLVKPGTGKRVDRGTN